MNFDTFFAVFSLYLNIRGLRNGPGKFFMGPGKSWKSPGFFVSKRMGTLFVLQSLICVCVNKCAAIFCTKVILKLKELVFLQLGTSLNSLLLLLSTLHLDWPMHLKPVLC